jgi:CheY-like chemotaxis protein
MRPCDHPIDLAALAAWDRLRRPVWIFDSASSRGVYANAAALELWGAPDLAELLSRDFSKLSPAVRTRTERLMALTADGSEVEERWTFYPNGQPVTVTAAISTVELADGRAALLFEAAPVDVEPEERRAVEALRHSSGPVGLFEPDGRSLFGNPAAFAAYGPDAGFVGRFVRPEEGEALLADAAREQATAAVFRMSTRHGERWHHLDCRPLHDPVTGGLSILLNERDVTDRIEAEAARAAAEQKAAMSEARQRFLTEMSHELRTPLNAVLGFSDLLRAAPLADEQQAFVARIHAAGSRLSEVVEQMIRGPDIPPESFAKAEPSPESGPSPPAPSAHAEDWTPAVLYVDDNESNRVLVTTLLATQGVRCETAEDGLQGLAAASQGGWDLILMDIQMPVMGGVECTRRIRALEGPVASVPIVALTANTLEDQLAAYAEAGMNDCIAKPVNAAELIHKVWAWTQAGLADYAAESTAA